jgi:LemA protein
VNADPLAVAAGFAVLLAIVVACFLIVTTFNAVVVLSERVDKAWANIDVALHQRHDALPNLVTAVRDVMSFERDLLTEVTRLRSSYAASDPIPDQAALSEATSGAVRTLLGLVERYPELRSAENVLALQSEIERLEDLIADRRELYNDQVFRHNTRIGQLPAVLLAPLFGWRERPLFRADDAVRERPIATTGGDVPAA